MLRRYRALQPAPISPAPDPGEGDSGAGPGAGPPPPQPKRPRGSSVSQACDNCKQAKAKCSSAHPICHRCAARSLSCSYAKERQKQRDEAMRARLETLEGFFSKIQTQSPEEANRTVQSIRSSGGISASSPHGSSLQGMRSYGSISATPSSSNPQEQVQGSPVNSRDDITNEEADARPTGAQNRDHSNAVDFGLPEPEVIAKSVDLFYDSSGPLFHVFSKPQAMALCARVYDPAQAPDHTKLKADVACVAAIAAVGAQYMNGGSDGDLDVRLYDIARLSFETAIEQRPHDAIKISALLAMFNIMSKATTAITYVEIGLGMARMQGVDWPGDLSHKTPALASCKTAWRTLVFCSCWLSSTLGYVSGNDIWFGKLPLSSFNAEDPTDLPEVVQAEMTKISMLKARILQMQMNFREQSLLSLGSMTRELQDWYEQLPPPLQLANLVEQGGRLPDSVWVSVCHTHLLYLGAIMLLHRKTVFQCMERFMPNVAKHNASTLLPDRKLLVERSTDGVSAAKHSATILNLLMERKTLYKRCWLVIFQSYTSCTAILHAVSQKQMHNFPKSEWSVDLQQGKACLSILEFCGGLDPVAYRFRERLATIYTKLASYEQTEQASALEQEHGDKYLFAVPEDAADEQKMVSWTLLSLLCQPFTEPADRIGAEEDVRTNFIECPYKRDHSLYTQLMEQLQWKYESTVPFNWDVQSLVGCDISGVNNEEQGHRFVGSHQPNFWRGGPGVPRQE